MIYANIELVIKKGKVTADNTLCLYRGDKNVEVRFILKDNRFIIQQNTFAQLIIKRPNANSIFSTVNQIQNNTVVFSITGDMINELDEMGYYDIQIRLFDDNRNARITLPPVFEAIEIRSPIADDSTVGTATAGHATAITSDEEEDTFLQDGSYNATNWMDGDIISAEKLNKVEDALSVINEKIDDIDITEQLQDYAKISELHSHSNKSALDEITSDKITSWDNKSTFDGDYSSLTNKPTIPTVTNDLTNKLKSDYDSAYYHSQSTHAPSDAQKNSDITKAEIEAKLIGNISSHTHNQYLTQHQDISHLAEKSEVPTKVSQLENDKGYLTEHQSLKGLASETYVDSKVSNLVDSAPETLDTLNELAQALGDDHNFATTVSTQIGKKVDKVDGKGLSTNDYTAAEKNKLAGIETGANKVTVYKAAECTTFTSDDGSCTPAAVKKAVGLFPPKAHEHSEYVTDDELNAKGYLTQHQDLSSYAKKTELPTKTSQLANDNGFITIAHEHPKPQPGKNFVNGYAGMTADGVMEVGKYQDWHNTSEETKDYSLRVQLDHSNANTVLWPTANGRLALQSDIDSKITAHANSSRITYRQGVGSTDRYYPLFKLEVDNSSNYGNIILKGRIGGWEQSNSAIYDITLLNRSSARDGRTITAMVSMQGDHTQSYQRADIVIYRQEDTSAIVYLKANGYVLWDFEFMLYQHTRLYDESYLTTVPTGELVWQLSTAPKTHLSSAGVFSVGSSPSELKELATKEYVDNKAISGGGGSDGTDHNHDDRYYTESEANNRYYGKNTGKLNIDTSYNGQLLMIQNGSNLPCGNQYGVVVNMPYRGLTGNSKTDFMGQILLPNGDDNTHPNSMFYRTSLGDTWNKWQEVETRQTKTFTLPATAGWYRIAEAPVGNVNGRVKLKAENGNYACATILDAVITKNKYPSLIPVAHSIYSSNSLAITQARILYVSGSATEKSYLEVYVSPNVALTMTVTSESSDWQLIDPIASEDSPSGYGRFSTTMSYNINGYAKHDHTHHKVTAMSFDSSGYLSITIDGVTKRFAPV